MLYNAYLHEFGTFAFLIDDTTRRACAVDFDDAPRGKETMPRRSESLAWLPGALVADEYLSAHAVDGGRAHHLAAGRVRSDVAKVTMTVGERTVDAVVVRGIHQGATPRTAGNPADCRPAGPWRR